MTIGKVMTMPMKVAMMMTVRFSLTHMIHGTYSHSFDPIPFTRPGMLIALITAGPPSLQTHSP